MLLLLEPETQSTSDRFDDLLERINAEALAALDRNADRLLQRTPAAPVPKDRAGRFPSADWEPPFTAGHCRLKPLLDGEPIVGALAAKAGRYGWVRYVDDHGTQKTQRGEVTIVRGDRF